MKRTPIAFLAMLGILAGLSGFANSGSNIPTQTLDDTSRIAWPALSKPMPVTP